MLGFPLPMLCPSCTSWVVSFLAVNSLHPQPLLVGRWMICCLGNSMQWRLSAWQGHEHSDNSSVSVLAVTGVRSLSEATWLPSGYIIYDANEMWAWKGHRKASDESPAPSTSSIKEPPPPPPPNTTPPAEAYRKPEPERLWLMFRVMHLQHYLFWSCHLFVISDDIVDSILIQRHCEKYVTLPREELNHPAE